MLFFWRGGGRVREVALFLDGGGSWDVSVEKKARKKWSLGVNNLYLGLLDLWETLACNRVRPFAFGGGGVLKNSKGEHGPL